MVNRPLHVNENSEAVELFYARQRIPNEKKRSPTVPEWRKKTRNYETGFHNDLTDGSIFWDHCESWFCSFFVRKNLEEIIKIVNMKTPLSFIYHDKLRSDSSFGNEIFFNYTYYLSIINIFILTKYSFLVSKCLTLFF